MYNVKTPSLNELPSSEPSTAFHYIAAITAAVILVTIVLPPNTPLIPTGVGRARNSPKWVKPNSSLAVSRTQTSGSSSSTSGKVPKQAVDIPVQSAINYTA